VGAVHRKTPPEDPCAHESIVRVIQSPRTLIKFMVSESVVSQII
jgi:hypothetical protein